MNFFEKLSQVMTGTKQLTMTIMLKDGKMSVGFFPEFTSKELADKMKMVSLTGTPSEIDEGFFTEISKPMQAATGLVSNADDVAKEIAEEVEEEKVTNIKRNQGTKAAEKHVNSKKAVAKPEVKKEVKKAAPKKAAKPVVSNGAPEDIEVEKIVTPAVDVDHNEGTTAEEIIQEAKAETVMTDSFGENPQPVPPTDDIIIDAPIPTAEEIHEELVADAEVDITANYNDLMTQGEQLFKAKDYKPAQELFSQAMELYDDQKHPNYLKASKLFNQASMWVKARERMNS